MREKKCDFCRYEGGGIDKYCSVCSRLITMSTSQGMGYCTNLILDEIKKHDCGSIMCLKQIDDRLTAIEEKVGEMRKHQKDKSWYQLPVDRKD